MRKAFFFFLQILIVPGRKTSWTAPVPFLLKQPAVRSAHGRCHRSRVFFHLFFLLFFSQFQSDSASSEIPLCAPVENMSWLQRPFKECWPCFAASWTFRKVGSRDLPSMCQVNRWIWESVFMWHWLRRRIKVSYFAAKWPPFCASVHEPLCCRDMHGFGNSNCTVRSGYLSCAWVHLCTASI